MSFRAIVQVTVAGLMLRIPVSEMEFVSSFFRILALPPAPQVENEDRWMAAQPPTSEFALNVSMARRSNGRASLGGLDGLSEEEASAGATRDFIFGFAMGAFLGVIMLLWMWETQVPRKQKFGILMGVTFKYSLMFVHRTFYPDKESAGGGGS